MSIKSISYDSETSQDTASGYKVMGESSDDNSDHGEDENKSSNGSMKEIDELKLLTRDLLNENWRMEQNKKLLHKMLELEEPSISPKVRNVVARAGGRRGGNGDGVGFISLWNSLTCLLQMIDFLLIDGTCEALLGFITQIGNIRRPYPHESDSLELRYSYRFDLSIYPSPPSSSSSDISFLQSDNASLC
jgi:hypothetical protein